jgi:hypothetical protein
MAIVVAGLRLHENSDPFPASLVDRCAGPRVAVYRRPVTDPTHRSSDTSDTAPSRRDAIRGFRLYRASFVAHVAVGVTWPLLFPFLVALSKIAAKHKGDGGPLDGVPVAVVALASGAPKLAMMVGLASAFALARSCRVGGVLATAIGALGVGLLGDAAMLAVPFAESATLADRIMWECLPTVTLLSGGASLLLVTGAIRGIAKKIDGRRVADRARRVQALAVGAAVIALGALVVWTGWPSTAAAVLALASLAAGLAAAVLHFAVARDLGASLAARVAQQASASPDSRSEESEPTRPTTAQRAALGLIGLTAVCTLVTGVALARHRQGGRNVLLLRAVSGGAGGTAERCGDPKSKLPIAVLEASHSTDDSESDPILALTANGDVFHRRLLVARISGACVLDPHGGVLVSVDAHGLLSGPGREPLGEFEAVETLRTSGGTVTVGEVLVDPDRAMTGIASDGTVYFVAPPSDGAGHPRSGEEAVSLPAGVIGEVSRARRTALLLESLIGRLDPNDR